MVEGGESCGQTGDHIVLQFSNSSGPVFGDSLLPVWKWIKPDATYGKNDFWEAELREALEDREGIGGQELIVLDRWGAGTNVMNHRISPKSVGKFSNLDWAELV